MAHKINQVAPKCFHFPSVSARLSAFMKPSAPKTPRNAPRIHLFWWIVDPSRLNFEWFSMTLGTASCIHYWYQKRHTHHRICTNKCQESRTVKNHMDQRRYQHILYHPPDPPCPPPLYRGSAETAVRPLQYFSNFSKTSQISNNSNLATLGWGASSVPSIPPSMAALPTIAYTPASASESAPSSLLASDQKDHICTSLGSRLRSSFHGAADTSSHKLLKTIPNGTCSMRLSNGFELGSVCELLGRKRVFKGYLSITVRRTCCFGLPLSPTDQGIWMFEQRSTIK